MRRTALLLVALATGLAGCFTVEGTLHADGSGRFHLTYYIQRHATIPDETRRLSSEHVHVDSLQGLGDLRASAEIRFDDVTKLASAETFRRLEVTRTREDDGESLRVVLRNTFDASQRDAIARWARENPDREGPKIALTLPAAVLAANRGAEVDGARVTWRVRLLEYAGADRLKFSVRYFLPGS
jgi:hypothetical protein